MRKLCAIFMLVFLLPFGAGAKEAEPVGEDPALEKRMMSIADELRCLVCQNQTIADSHAELAVDLRNQIREKLHQGATDKEIMDYMVARYGDFVLYRPPMKPTTLLLWFGPGLLVVAGAVVLFINLKRRRRKLAETDLTVEEEQRVQGLLSGGTEGEQT